MFTPPLPPPLKGAGNAGCVFLNGVCPLHDGQSPDKNGAIEQSRGWVFLKGVAIPLPFEGNRKLGVSDWRPKGGRVKGRGGVNTYQNIIITIFSTPCVPHP